MLLYVIVYGMNFSFKDFPILKDLGFFKKTEDALGLDIGTAGIKVVQLRKEKERAVLETYGEIATGPYANMNIGQSVKLSEEKAVEAIKDVLREANVKSKKAAVSIPLKSSFVTIIKIPVIEGKNMSEMIELEARRYIPVSISEVEMDWWVLPEMAEREQEEKEGGGKRKFAKVLLAAIHKNVITKYKEIVSMAGLEMSALEIESFSMMRSCIGRETEPVVLIDIGSSAVKMTVVDFGIMMAVHSLPKGSQDLTLAISHSLGIDFGRAEEMKREIGLSELPEHREIKEIIEPILEYVFSDINRLIRDYQKKQGRTVSRVILTGGGSSLKGIVGFSVKRLSLETSLADPFSKTEYPAFLGEALKEAGPAFSVSLGLALRGLQ